LKFGMALLKSAAANNGQSLLKPATIRHWPI
jgi:hypothetical protein